MTQFSSIGLQKEHEEGIMTANQLDSMILEKPDTVLQGHMSAFADDINRPHTGKIELKGVRRPIGSSNGFRAGQ